MENIKFLPPMERPREKLQFNGAHSLSDQELLAILLGTGMPGLPLNQICDSVMAQYSVADIARLNMDTLCGIKGIGLAKATTIVAALEFSRRAQGYGDLLASAEDAYLFVRDMLLEEIELKYILLLISDRRELLAFSEAGSVLPDIGWLTELGRKAGARYLLLTRNGWPAFSHAEGHYVQELKAACEVLDIEFEGLMAVSPKRFKMCGDGYRENRG